MKNIFCHVFILASFFSYGQTISEINKVLNISDSLIHKKEIRIYKKFEITNGTEVFRYYENVNNDWKIEFYKYFHSVNKKPKYEKFNIESRGDNDLIWLNIIASNIEFLPEFKEIEYKLKGKAIIHKINGDYELSFKKLAVLDGIDYKVYVRNGEINNFIQYGNPETYLKHYPGVNELNSFSTLLRAIQYGFGIWIE